MKEKIVSFLNLAENRKLIMTLLMRFILFSCSSKTSNILNMKHFAKRKFFQLLLYIHALPIKFANYYFTLWQIYVQR